MFTVYFPGASSLILRMDSSYDTRIGPRASAVRCISDPQSQREVGVSTAKHSTLTFDVTEDLVRLNME